MAFLAETNRCASFKDGLWSLLMGDQLREELAAKVVTCAWALWHNRNEVRHGGERKPGNVLLRWALHYLDEYYAAVDFYQTPPAPVTQIPAWIPSSDPSFKVNVDGATFSEMGAVGVGVGVCVRDDQGRLAAALSKKIPAPLGVIETEAKAVEVGMQFAKDIGLQDFILESDSLILHRALTGLAVPPTSVASVVLGIQAK